MAMLEIEATVRNKNPFTIPHSLAERPGIEPERRLIVLGWRHRTRIHGSRDSPELRRHACRVVYANVAQKIFATSASAALR